MKKYLRRDFLKTASAAAIAGTVAAGCGTETDDQKTAASPGKTYEWRMVTTWPPNFHILGEYAVKTAKWIESISNGRLKIHVYGGGELVPALEVFDTVSYGAVEMGHGAAYYWAGKSPAAQFFTAVPFGMNTQQLNAWLYDGGGIELWTELYANYNLVPFPCGNTGGQMGGWFNREINSLSDLKGLKIRMPGLGGKVISKAGATSILSPGGELYTNLERGVIDALEWVGPYHDYLMGFHEIAKYYYSPGWQEPTATLELIVNKNAFDQLPDDLKEVIRVVSAAANVMILSEFEARNSEYFLRIKNEGKVSVRTYPDDVLERLQELSFEVINEMTAQDNFAKKVYNSYSIFQNNISGWTNIIEKNYGAKI
jgi:TRAP-type mannitol/chloroaromatic compound transport system substrate-binding protein